MSNRLDINDPVKPCSPKTRDAIITVHCYDLTDAAIDALFDRVADAAHALDEQVMCSGAASITRKRRDWRYTLAAWLIR